MPRWIEVIEWISRAVLGVVVILILIYFNGIFWNWLWRKLRGKEGKK